MTNKSVAVIAPIPDLEQVRGRSYHLVEAPLVLNSGDYRDFYLQESISGAYITVDNGTWLHKVPVSTRELIQAARLVQAKEVVVPDVFEDPEGTIREARNFLEVFVQWGSFALMIVPQGKNTNEWLNNWSDLQALSPSFRHGRATVAIPKHMASKVVGGRWALACAMWRRYAPDTQLHLLGGTGDPTVDLNTVRDIPTVRSMDTSEPFAMAQQGIVLGKGTSRRGPLDFLRTSGVLGEENYTTYKRWMSDRELD